MAFLGAAAAPADATTPFIHAHRGGPLVDGTPTYGENTLPAFRNAASKGFVLELDVKLTQDDVPVVIHDATLDRVTACTGEVAARTLAQLDSCPVDILGTEGSEQPASDPQPIPTLEQVLAIAREQRARVNIEIKNQPTDPDFDGTSGYANRVMDEVLAADIPGERTIIQSFWPPNLGVAQNRFPDAEISYLTLGGLTAGGIASAKNAGYEWVSPQGATESEVAAAHAAGRRVVPYTLDSESDIKGAAAAGVDELISNDPTLARRALAEVDPPAPAAPAAPSDEACRAARAKRTLPPVEAYDSGPQAPRVFAIQFKQEARHIETYATFRTKMECLVREMVLPRLARGRPNVVALNEDVGLLTIGTGSRGAAAREVFKSGGAVAALNAVTASYAPVLAAYQSRFTSTKALAAGFWGATDTFARGWMQVFSDLSKRYGVYMLGSNNQPRFRESTNASEIDVFRDPDIARPRSVYVALDDRVYNEVFMWAPQDRLSEGPRLLRNVVTQNRKVPLTDIEKALQLTPGPSTGPDAEENLRPYALPGSGARISFATSLPAFTYGDAGGDPCADTSKTYMRCMDRLGANLVMQDEANPGQWGTDVANGAWQPLEWMTSTWRAASDPTVGFTYNVTPHMVGNLADLPFDGQTAITQRGLRASPGCTYVGNKASEPGDERYQAEQGPKSEFIAILPWVTPDASRAELQATAKKLAPRSGDPLENDYAEGVIAADLPFPANPNRAGCVTAAAAQTPADGDDDSNEDDASPAGRRRRDEPVRLGPCRGRRGHVALHRLLRAADPRHRTAPDARRADAEAPGRTARLAHTSRRALAAWAIRLHPMRAVAPRANGCLNPRAPLGGRGGSPRVSAGVMARHQLDYPLGYGLSGPDDSVWAGRYRCEWGRTVGGRVRQWRQQAGLHLRDLGPMAPRADGGQYSPSFFSRLERGWASPPLFVYIALAEAFETEPGRLLGLEEPVKQVSEAELTVIKLIRRLELEPEDAILRLTRSASAAALRACE